MNKYTVKTMLLTSLSVLKIAIATKEKTTTQKICDATELSQAYVSKILRENPDYFQFTGYCAESPKKPKQFRVKPLAIEMLRQEINRLQAKFDSEGAQEVLEILEPQFVYKNPYDQLMRAGQIVNCKIGQAFTFAENHTDDYIKWAKQQRLERKSARTHVGIADYGAFV